MRLEAWHVRFHMCDVPAFGSAFWELKLQMFYATIGYELYAQDIGICILVHVYSATSLYAQGAGPGPDTISTRIDALNSYR